MFTAQLQLISLVGVFCIIVWSGLHPFDFFKRNAAVPVDRQHGLMFDGFGLVYSADEIEWDTDSEQSALTFEIWLRTYPVQDRQPRSFLTLIDDTKLTPLGIRQEGSDLVVWDAVTNPGGDRWYNDFRVEKAIRANELQHLVVTSGSDPPRIFLNGFSAKLSHGARIPIIREQETFGGTLVIGSGPPWNLGWSGEFLGLVIHGQVLSAEAIRQGAKLSLDERFTELGARSAEVIAQYRFDDSNELMLTDRSGNGHSLVKPAFYHVPRREFLEPVAFRNGFSYWNAEDALLNFSGFACLGFLFASVVRARLPRMRLLVLAGMVGFSIGLTFEFLQVMMVSRHSSLQDLILNTLGTVAGGVAYLSVRGFKKAS